MSLVGPRPAGLEEFPNYKSWQRRRLSVKPGLTCIWQVRGRNGISNFNEWVNLDLEYIDNWSLWLDIKLLCQTIPAVITKKGAS
jgi:lipopolysaccharide/colanic/teichoic acid biosynthesis glycosyltransferase